MPPGEPEPFKLPGPPAPVDWPPLPEALPAREPEPGSSPPPFSPITGAFRSAPPRLLEEVLPAAWVAPAPELEEPLAGDPLEVWALAEGVDACVGWVADGAICGVGVAWLCWGPRDPAGE